MTYPFPSVQDARGANCRLGRLENSDRPLTSPTGSVALKLSFGAMVREGVFTSSFRAGGPQRSLFMASTWQLSNSAGSCV